MLEPAAVMGATEFTFNCDRVQSFDAVYRSPALTNFLFDGGRELVATYLLHSYFGSAWYSSPSSFGNAFSTVVGEWRPTSLFHIDVS